MNQKNVTLKQLAQELDVSISTVSKALNDSYEINDKTIERVKALAKKYNYRPNKVAKNLRNRQTKTIGVIIPNILNYFFAKVLLGIEEEANKRGYQIIISLSNNKYQKEVDSLKLLSDGSVDGFILSVAKETQKLNKSQHFQRIIDDGYPITMFDRVSNKIKNCNKVTIDDEKTTYNATKHLFNSGCKKIALITSLNDSSVGKLRIKGYKAAIKNYSEKNHPIVLEIKDKTEYEPAINKLIKDYPDIDGILASDNVSSAVALKVVKRNGFHVPKDISIIGFSDNKTSRLLDPPLTVINQNALEIGKNAVITLIESIANTNSFSSRTIDSGILERGSTRK